MANPISPLQGKRIVITRAADQTRDLVESFRERGADPILIPLIEFHALCEGAEARSLIGNLDSFDWIVFTSQNAIRFFFSLAGNVRIPDSVQLACVGRQSAATLGTFGYYPSFIPTQFSTNCLINEIDLGAGQSVLYPCPKKNLSNQVKGLEARGASVTPWPIYETGFAPLSLEQRMVLDSGIDAITFASPSAVDSYVEQVPRFQIVGDSVVVACIGPTTCQRALKQGLHVDVVPDEFSAAGLGDALEEYYLTSTSKGNHG